MSKFKAIMHGALGTMSAAGAVSTATGHDMLHVAAVFLKVKVSPNVVGRIAKYQWGTRRTIVQESWR